MQALESGGDNLDLSQLTMYPCIVPDRGVSEQTMDAALATLNELVERNRRARKKPWWKFW